MRLERARGRKPPTARQDDGGRRSRRRTTRARCPTQSDHAIDANRHPDFELTRAAWTLRDLNMSEPSERGIEVSKDIHDVHHIVNLTEMYGCTSACKVECRGGFGRVVFISVHCLDRDGNALLSTKMGIGCAKLTLTASCSRVQASETLW